MARFYSALMIYESHVIKLFLTSVDVVACCAGACDTGFTCPAAALNDNVDWRYFFAGGPLDMIYESRTIKVDLYAYVQNGCVDTFLNPYLMFSSIKRLTPYTLHVRLKR